MMLTQGLRRLKMAEAGRRTVGLNGQDMDGYDMLIAKAHTGVPTTTACTL